MDNSVFTMDHDALKVASNKVTNHEKMVFDNHVFIQFAFDSFGFLTSEVMRY